MAKDVVVVIGAGGIGVTIAYDAILSFVLLFIIDKTMGLRVSPEAERDGLDIALHGESLA